MKLFSYLNSISFFLFFSGSSAQVGKIIYSVLYKHSGCTKATGIEFLAVLQACKHNSILYVVNEIAPAILEIYALARPYNI